MIMIDHTSNVARGVELLDSRFANWRKVIDLDKLDMLSLDNCVLGQLFGSYSNGVSALWFAGYHSDWANEHGFDTCAEYGELTRVWKDAVSGGRAWVDGHKSRNGEST